MNKNTTPMLVTVTQAGKPVWCASSPLVNIFTRIIGGPHSIEVALSLLDRFPEMSLLATAHPVEIAQVNGIGEKTAERIKASLELAGHILVDHGYRERVHSPQDAATILTPLMAHLEQEYLYVMLLDTKGRMIDVVEIYHGALNASTVRVAEVFREAIRRNAASILVAHNHPSSDPSPSPDDIAITREIVQIGKVMDIKVVDHVVISTQGFTSFKEKGLGFS